MIKYFIFIILFSSFSFSKSLINPVRLKRIEISNTGEYHYKFNDETEIKDKSAGIAVLLLSHAMIEDHPDTDIKYFSSKLVFYKSEQLKWLRYFMSQIVQKEKDHPLYMSLKNLNWIDKKNEITYGDILNSDLGYKLNQFKKDKKVFIKHSSSRDFKFSLLCENNVKNEVGLLFLSMNFDSKNTESWRKKYKIEFVPNFINLGSNRAE